MQVKCLWTKLMGTQDCSYEVFKSDTKPQFSSSVGKLQEDLSNSVQQQARFLSQVKVVKRLFESPTSGKNK